MISPNIVILTREELEQIKSEEFRRGVRRGRFEESYAREYPESDLVRPARPPAPHGNGTTVGAQPVAQSAQDKVIDVVRRLRREKPDD